MDKEKIKPLYERERPEPAEYTGRNDEIDQAADPKKAGKGIAATGESASTEAVRARAMGKLVGSV